MKFKSRIRDKNTLTGSEMYSLFVVWVRDNLNFKCMIWVTVRFREVEWFSFVSGIEMLNAGY